MRLYVFAPVVAITVALLIATPVCATEDGNEELRGSVADYYSSLPDEIKQLLPEELEDQISGEDGVITCLDGEFALELIYSSSRLGIAEVLPLICEIAVFILVSSVIRTASEGISDKPTASVGSVILVCICGASLTPVCKEVVSAVRVMGAVIKAALPTVAMIGGTVMPSGASVSAVWLSTLLALSEQLCESVILPLCSVCLSFVTVGAISRQGNGALVGVTAAIKKAFVTLLTALATVLSAVMTFQSVIAKGSDSVLLRSIRFASCNTVPVVGGTVSEVAGAYISSVVLIKGSFGAVCAAAVTVCALPLIIKLFILRSGMSALSMIASAVGSPLALDVNELSSVVDLLIAISVITAVAFTLAIGVFASVMPS